MKNRIFTLYSLVALLLFTTSLKGQVTPTYPTTILQSPCWQYSQAWAVGMTSPTTAYTNIQFQSGTTPTACGTSPATASFTFQPYNGGSSLKYTFSGNEDLTNATLSIDFNANFSGKYAFVSVSDGVYSTLLDLTTIVPIPNSTTATNYSFDFNTVKGSCNLAAVKSVSVMIYNESTGNTSPSGLNGNFTISGIQVVAGATGVNTVTNPSLGQEWQLESNGVLYNANSLGVLIGAKPNAIPSSLLAPYYKSTLVGPVNVYGGNNAFEVWSPNLIGGTRQYLGIGNYSFSDNTEYSLINSGAYSGFIYSGKSLIIQNNTGNVGIGSFTSAPSYKLSVNGNASFGGLATYIGIYNSTFTANPSSGTSFNTINGYTNSGASNGHIIFQNYQDTYLTGNVGIGYFTSAPTEKLSVNGNVRCKQVIGTQLGWSDYVFASGYQLRSLNDVKEYIEKEKHLPGVPSESVIVSEGLNMNEMLKIHMEKIEELTLYLIKQQEQIESLKEEVKKLEAEKQEE